MAAHDIASALLPRDCYVRRAKVLIGFALALTGLRPTKSQCVYPKSRFPCIDDFLERE
jgi:hypothetical protein